MFFSYCEWCIARIKGLCFVFMFNVCVCALNCCFVERRDPIILLNLMYVHIWWQVILSFVFYFNLYLYNMCIYICLSHVVYDFAVYLCAHFSHSTSSTCFLMGPLNQIKKMFASTRVIATVIVIVSFALTLIAALWVIIILFMNINYYLKINIFIS